MGDSAAICLPAQSSGTRVQHQHKTRAEPAVGGLPVGVHQAIGNGLEAAPAADCPADIRRTGSPVDGARTRPTAPGRTAPGHGNAAERTPTPRTTWTSSAASWAGPSATSWRSAARCVCGNPLVAATAPRLSNGIPFPTTFYLTHPVITSAVSRLEAAGLMNEMNDRLARRRRTWPPRTAPPTRHYLAARPRSARAPASVPSPRSTASRPAECPPASSACTSWWATRWPPDRASTRSATRRSRPSPNGGPRTAATATAPGTPAARPRPGTSAATGPQGLPEMSVAGRSPRGRRQAAAGACRRRRRTAGTPAEGVQ